MDLRTFIRKSRTAMSLLRRPQVDIYQAVNEEKFWDYYVGNWEQSDALNKGNYVGTEWQFEAEFVSLLKKHASQSSRALEIGCGGGRVTATGVTLFNHVCAADLSTEMLRKCKQAVPAANVTFHKLDGFTLSEFADSSIDFVYAHDVFVQLSSMQVYPYLMEIRRVLNTGGSAMVSCYDAVDRFEMFKETSLRLWKARQFPIYRRLHFITEEMLRRMLTDLGLEVLEVQKGRFLTVAFRKN